jgi:cobalamin biosynthesis protein CobD/CbiB
MMLRAIAGLIFIIITLSVTAFVISLLVKVTGVDGMLAVIISIPVCLGALALSVTILELINSRINDKARDEQATDRKILH